MMTATRPSSSAGLPIATPTSKINNATSVQVALRIRPPAPDHDSSVPSRFQRTVVKPVIGTDNALYVDAVSAAVAASPAKSVSASKQTFSFDRVYGSTHDQEAVYSSVQPLVEKFLQGYNTTIMAYGQTGSGKSFTLGTDQIYGDSQEQRLGVIPRAVAQIFDFIDHAKKENPSSRIFVTKVSYVEIYNEDLLDLLVGDVPKSDRATVTIREERDGTILWSGLREPRVLTADDVMNYLEDGSSIRQTGSTAMNEQSSRSHAIFSITLTQKKLLAATAREPPSPIASRMAQRASTSGLPRNTSPLPGSRPMSPSLTDKPSRIGMRPASSLGINFSPAGKAQKEDGDWMTITSKIHFVDLAGSERLKRTSAIGDRAKEGISINGGLLALGNVISALGDPSKARSTTYIPYRDSKLTRLLQDSLGGNTQTLMIACVSPVEYNVSETLNTLKYANRARNIKNRAEVNEIEVGWDDVEHLQGLVKRLRAEIAALKSDGISAALSSATSSRPVSWSSNPSQAQLELQEKYASLCQDYARVTAEMAASQVDGQDFSLKEQNVVEVYETTLSALESQLSLTKAALAVSEESRSEQETNLAFQQQVNESNHEVISDLKTRLSKLSEREATTEAYIRDLEVKLEQSGNTADGSANIMLEMRKEIAKYREIEANSERYIKDLEIKLASSEEAGASYRAQVEVLEKEVERRELAYLDLEKRLALLDTSEVHKALLQELEDKNRHISRLENDLANTSSASTVAPHERSDFYSDAVSNISSASLSADGFNHPSMQTSVSTPVTSDGLQLRYQETLDKLNDVDAKYQASLREIQELQSRIEEIRLEREEERDGTPSPPGTVNYHNSSPTETFLSSSPKRNRTSIPISPGRSFLARAPARASSSNSLHLRSSSSSLLSQELISAQNQNALSTPLFPTTPNRMRRSPSLSKESLNEFFIQSPERSSESFQKEIRTLQETLEHRDQELQALESRIGQLTGLRREDSGLSIESDGPQTPEDIRQRDIQTLSPKTLEVYKAIKMNMEQHVPNETDIASLPQEMVDQTARLDDLMLSMAQKEASHRESVDKLQDQLATITRAHTDLQAVSKDQVINMSQEIERLRTQLTTQQEDTTAIDSVQQELHAKVAEIEKSRAEVDRHLETVARMKAEHDEIMKRRGLESAEKLKQLQDEHAGTLRRMLEQREELFVQKSEEFDKLHRAAEEKQNRLLKQSAEQHQKQLRDREEELESIILRKTKEHEEALERFEIERASFTDSTADTHSNALKQLEAQHKKVLDERETTHSQLLANLKVDHESLLQSRSEEHSKAQERIKEDYETRINRIRDDHSSTLHQLRDERDDEIQKQRESHREALEIAKSAAEARIANLKESHTQELADIQASHALQISELGFLHQAEIDKLASSHSLSMETRMTDATESHQRELSELSSKHDEVVRQMQEAQSSALAASVMQYEQQLQSLQNPQDKQLGNQSSQQDGSLDNLQNSHNAVLHTLQTVHDAEIAKLHSEHMSTLAKQQEEHQAVIDQLKVEHSQALQATGVTFATEGNQEQRLYELESQLANLQRERDDLLLQIKNAATTSSELQDAMDALSTLEKALIESQEERDHAVEEIQQIKNQASTSDSTVQQLQSELSVLRAERDQLRAEKASRPTIPARSESLRSDKETMASRSLARIARGSNPPTPPPTTALPPLPTAPSRVVSPTSDRAPSALARRPSESSNGSHDSHQTLDQQVRKRLDEQETHIAQLTTQLAHCETDLRANIDLVNTLESALNDSERNLRKVRVQLGDIARQRDSATSENEELRQKINEAKAEVDDVRHSLQLREEETRSTLDAQRRAQNEALLSAERRAEEMMKSHRKSKFNCF